MKEKNILNKAKTSKQIERHVKGIANHWRIEILLLVAKNPGISVEGIAKRLESNLKTTAEHTRRLAQAGLIDKKYSGRAVEHALSPYGKMFVDFLISFRDFPPER